MKGLTRHCCPSLENQVFWGLEPWSEIQKGFECKMTRSDGAGWNENNTAVLWQVEKSLPFLGRSRAPNLNHHAIGKDCIYQGQGLANLTKRFSFPLHSTEAVRYKGRWGTPMLICLLSSAYHALLDVCRCSSFYVASQVTYRLRIHSWGTFHSKPPPLSIGERQKGT